MTETLATLDKELDRTKAKVFIGNNAAFLGSLVCSMQFVWDSSIPTASTDGFTIWWNPEWFSTLTTNQRVFVLVHELWHPARLHFQRRGSRDPRTWNEAADYVINNDLVATGYKLEGLDGLVNPNFIGLAEEEVYELIKDQKIGLPNFGQDDIREPSKEAQAATVNNVVRALHEARAANQSGNLPGGLKEIIDGYLKPVVPWQDLLSRFLEDLLEEDYTWARPNRRYQDIYLPSRFIDEGKLQKLNYYLDVSGSITSSQILRFHSEVKYVKERYNPNEMNLVQFDVRIQKETLIAEKDSFDGVEIIGRGGTSLHCVRQHIIDNKPTAAIIFTDLYCHPMEKLPFDIPIIWVVSNHKGAKVPFGKTIYINE